MDKSMHRAKCDKCGNHCEVPFKPTGSKPIFCSGCFKGKSDQRGGSRSRFGDRDRGRERYGDRDRDRQMHKTTCDDCGDRCEVPFKPSGDKPVRCDKCFGKGRSSGRGGSDQLEKQFEMLNTKLDKILKEITTTVTVDLDEKKSKKEMKKEDKPKKTVKKKAASPVGLRPRAAKKTTKKAAVKKPAAKKATKKVAAKKKPAAKKKK
jgi:CxxC-x17-CxxC domain-containing protein